MGNVFEINENRFDSYELELTRMEQLMETYHTYILERTEFYATCNAGRRWSFPSTSYYDLLQEKISDCKITSYALYTLSWQHVHYLFIVLSFPCFKVKLQYKVIRNCKHSEALNTLKLEEYVIAGVLYIVAFEMFVSYKWQIP